MITKVEDVDKNSAFYQYMYGICSDESQADEVVKFLEGISSSGPMPYSREFCISYVIKLLEKYCSTDECELALARYGFLDGFERKKYKRIGRRTEEYWKYACKYNQHEFISDDWTTTGTALTELRDRHMIIVGNLDEITSQIKAKNGGKLGLIEEVPEKLEFPKPRKIEEVTSMLENDIAHTLIDGESENSHLRVEVPPSKVDNLQPASTNKLAVEDSTKQEDAEENPLKPVSVRVKIPWRLKLPIILASIVAVPLISVLSILIYQYKVTPPEIKQISAKTEVLVEPGEKEDLALDVYPDSADWGQLSSKIGNKEIVGVTNDWWVVGLDGLGDNDSDNTAIVIWGGKAEPALITVTVVKPGSRGK